MARTAYHHGDLSQQAHQQALATLREQGDGAISLRALARQLGVSAPALYRHYAEAVNQQDSRKALIGIGLAYVAFARDEPNLYRLMFGGRVLPRGAHPRLDQAGQAAFQVLEDTVANGQQRGYLKAAPLSLLTAAAWSLVHGLSQLTIDGHLPGPDSEPQLAAGITALLLDGSIERTTNKEPNP